MFNTKGTRNNFIVLGKLLKRPIKRLLPAAIKARILPASEAVISDKTWDQEQSYQLKDCYMTAL
jgi:hypothetical protein